MESLVHNIRLLSPGILSLLLPVFVPSHASESIRLRLAPMDLEQEQGHDYDETFAFVAHMTTMRTLLVVASVRHCSVSQLNVQNAFLNGELPKEVYMKPPLGYSVPDGMFCRLRRSLYGLKQPLAPGLSASPMW
jgi:hypothetical protein